MKLPAEDYILMYVGIAEHLLFRDGVTLEFFQSDEFGNVERNDASDDLWIDYCNEAEELLAELGVCQEEWAA